jgi:hypothetical protein
VLPETWRENSSHKWEKLGQTFAIKYVQNTSMYFSDVRTRKKGIKKQRNKTENVSYEITGELKPARNKYL